VKLQCAPDEPVKKIWRRRNDGPATAKLKRNDYFFWSPVVLVSCVVVFSVEPPGVETVSFFWTFVLSLQPTIPTDKILNTKTDARMRFMFSIPYVMGYRTNLASPGDGQLSIGGPSCQ
jgi:hypothetical protein